MIETKLEQLRSQKYDKPCPKCGTVVSFSLGIGDCPRCSGLDNSKLIDLHIQQAEEQRDRAKLGKVMLSVALIFGVVVAAYLFLF